MICHQAQFTASVSSNAGWHYLSISTPAAKELSLANGTAVQNGFLLLASVLGSSLPTSALNRRRSSLRSSSRHELDQCLPASYPTVRYVPSIRSATGSRARTSASASDASIDHGAVGAACAATRPGIGPNAASSGSCYGRRRRTCGSTRPACRAGMYAARATATITTPRTDA